MGIVNNCIRSLSVNFHPKLSWEQIVGNYGSELANFLQKMRDANRMPKVYQPGRYGKREDEMLDVLGDTAEPPPISTKVGNDPNEVISSCWNG